MKAKDLAALAALGVAGFAAYDKFGKKKDAPASGARAGAELGKSGSAIDGEAGEDDARDNVSRSKAPMGENAAGSRFTDRDRVMGKDAAGSRFTDRDVPDKVLGKDAAGSRFTGRDIAVQKSAAATSVAPVAVKPVAAAPAAKEVVESKRPMGENAAGSRFTSRDKRPMGENAAGSRFTSRDATPAQRIADIDAKSGASSASAKKTEELAAYSKAEAAEDLEKKKKNGTFVPIPQNVKPAVVKTPVVTPPPPVSAAAAARQRALDEKNFDSDLMKGRRQAVVDTLQGIPSSIANIFKPKEKEFQNKTYRDFSGNIVKYAKGGAVKKMASGGMTSSKMSSKPSTASSRGDGIAQRGKTRGQMR